jgi:hypothetical protein
MEGVVRLCRKHKLFFLLCETGGKIECGEVNENRKTWRMKYLKTVVDEKVKPIVKHPLSGYVNSSNRKRDKEYSDSQKRASDEICESLKTLKSEVPVLFVFQPAGSPSTPCKIFSHDVTNLNDPRVFMIDEIASIPDSNKKKKSLPREISSTDVSVKIVNEKSYIKTCLSKVWPNDISFPDEDTLVIDITKNKETLQSIEEKCNYFNECLQNKQTPIIF